MVAPSFGAFWLDAGFGLLDLIPGSGSIVVIGLFSFLYTALAISLYIQYGYIKFTFSKKKERALSKKELSVKGSERGKLSQGLLPPMVELPWLSYSA